MNLLLFDIDGTLISSREFLKVYTKQLEKGLEKFFGKSVPVDFSGLHGNTERYNIRVFLQRSEIDYNETMLDNFFKEFGESYQVNQENLIVLPYVVETLSSLKQRNMLGIVTGNQEIVARKRLRTVKLESYFRCGGFGDESYNREQLILMAIEKFRKMGWEGDSSKIYVIGDTTKDIDAGKKNGVKTIGASTGSATKKELEEYNPDYVINNLSELLKIF